MRRGRRLGQLLPQGVADAADVTAPEHGSRKSPVRSLLDELDVKRIHVATRRHTKTTQQGWLRQVHSCHSQQPHTTYPNTPAHRMSSKRNTTVQNLQWGWRTRIPVPHLHNRTLSCFMVAQAQHRNRHQGSNLTEQQVKARIHCSGKCYLLAQQRSGACP
jgi:hypothetical protein